MCGFAGIFKKNLKIDESILKSMLKKLHHRGPDDQGIWLENNIGLAHARLSIQDLSYAAHQPMLSLNQRFVIAFNGEIYNHLDLKKELIQEFSCHFMTHSDTEVLVNAISFWGIEKTLKKLIGMFAFALWDRLEKLLYLARDRFGEKPLYYGKIDHDFVFSSELDPIKIAFKGKLNIDKDTLATYMHYGYVPTPYSIYSEIKKLEPGVYLILKENLEINSYTYWSAIDTAIHAKKNPLSLSFDEAVDELDRKLKKTISMQMLGDVPLGAFLSGGVDSSTVVALMQSLSDKPIKTFSIGFKEKKYDESLFAKNIAHHLGTDHTELIVTDKEAMAVIPKIAGIYGEPFADSSQIPTYLVSQLARKEVTVALSGDAGDELFGGYHRYFLASRVVSLLSNPFLNRLIRHFPEKIFYALRYFPQKNVLHFSKKFQKLKQLAFYLNDSFSSLYHEFCTQSQRKEALILQGKEREVITQARFLTLFDSFSKFEWMMLIDTLTYLLDDILVKVDRAAMSVSLETRIPFLDHTIFEFAWALPEKYKFNASSGKLVLKHLLYRYLPSHLIDRPKMGFGIPFAEWLRGGLSTWAKDLLNKDTLQGQGYLNVNLVQSYLNDHLSNKRDWHGILWNILMFQEWLLRQD